jgi:hypothetical protein
VEVNLELYIRSTGGAWMIPIKRLLMDRSGRS